MKKGFILLSLLIIHFCLYSISGFGQQVIGAFPSMDGGFGGQTLGQVLSASVSNTPDLTQWSARGGSVGTATTPLPNILLLRPRTGPKHISIFNLSASTGNPRIFMTPAASLEPSTHYIIQFYCKASNGTNFPTTKLEAGIQSVTGTSAIYKTFVPSGDPNVYQKITLDTFITNPNPMNNGFGAIKISGGAGTGAFALDIDDWVVYPGSSPDETAPEVPGLASVGNPSANTLDLSWAASSDVDGGGYIVIRYTSSPDAEPDPNANGIYQAGDSIGNGVVAYIGTGTGFTDTRLTGSTTYFYRIYAVDKAFNYSSSVITSGSTNEDLNNPKFYIDSIAGNDNNLGTIQAPWKNISKLNNMDLLPGTQVYLKCGSRWSGQKLKFRGTGTAAQPIKITSYGTGAQPLLAGNGITGEAVVYLYNQEYIEISNLEITNTPRTPSNSDFFVGLFQNGNNPLGADRRGVMVALDNFGTANHIYLKNLNIHHIKGQLGSGATTVNGAIPKRTGGIYFTVLGNTEQPASLSRFNDVLIDSCTISYAENIGIAFDNEWNVYYPGGTEYNDWFSRRFSNIKISNNKLNYIGKNAIIVRCTDSTGLIEKNVCSWTAMGTTGNTMFSARAKGTVFQYNEGSYNRASIQTIDPGNQDGSLYDPDFGSIGVIFQYSYSHDNSEGIYWGCNTRGTNNNTTGVPDVQDTGCTLRYCISQNDKGRLVHFNYSSAGNEIYNNVFYIQSGLSPTIITENGGNGHTYNYFNNIIYNQSGSARYNFSNGTPRQNRTILNNVFFGNHPSSEPSDAAKLTSDPLFVNPGSGIDGIASLNGYKLLEGSPAMNNGKIIANNGGKDFYGTSVPNNIAPNRGAYQTTTTIEPIITIGSFPKMDGGFENQNIGDLMSTPTSSTPDLTYWSRGGSSGSGNASILSTRPRSGSQHITVLNTKNNLNTSPRTYLTPSSNIAISTPYIIQFYCKASDGVNYPNTRLEAGISSATGDTATYKIFVPTGDPARYQKITLDTFIANFNPFDNNGFGAIKIASNTSNLGYALDVDDWVVYPGTQPDNTPPADPGAAQLSLATPSSLHLNWTASADVDGGGYLAIRYTADPTSEPAPNVNGIYQVGNTIGTGKVVYIGSDNNFIDTLLNSATRYYYRIYTTDKAFNYSGHSSANGITLGALVPVATPSTTSLSGFTYIAGNGPSTAQSFSVTFSNLSVDLMVEAPANYEISLSSTGTYTDLLGVPFSSSSATIFVRLKADLNPATFSENINLSSNGVLLQTIALNGSVTVPPVPFIATPNPASLNAFNYILGSGPSASQSFTISGSRLTNDITVSGSANYEVSLSAGTGFASSVTIPQSGGNIAVTNVYVRLKNVVTAGTYNETINITSNGAVPRTVSCNGTVAAPPSPVISGPLPTSLTGFSYAVNAGPSAQQSFSVSGSNLTSNMVIGAPANYEVTLNTGTNFSSSVNITPSGGTVPSTTVYVRLKSGLAIGTYNENISISSTNATSQTVSCSGSVNAGAAGRSFVATWPFTVDSLPVVSGNVSASGAFMDPTLFRTSRVYGINGLTGTGSAGRASTPACNVTYNAAGTITPYMEMSMAPNAGYSASLDAFNFKIKAGTISSAMVISAGYSTDNGVTFTGFDISKNNVPITPAPGTTGTPLVTNDSLVLSAPALSVNAGDSLKIRIIYWKNGSSSTSLNPITIGSVVINGTTQLNGTGPIISNPIPTVLNDFNYVVGAGPSTEQQFDFDAINLTSPISIVPTANYEVSLSSGSGFTSSISLPASTTSASVYVRLKAGLAAGTYNDSVIISSTGAASRKLYTNGFVLSNVVVNNDYFIDSYNGNDNNNGSEASPWKNISILNNKTFRSGDRIHLKCGSRWKGQQLKFKGSGNVVAPIIVTSYGTGPKPFLSGNGLIGEAVVYLYNQQYVEISNLEITNTPNEPFNGDFFVGLFQNGNNPLGGDRRGVMVALDDFGKASHIYLKNLNIHHIKGQLGSGDAEVNGAIPKKTGGIYFAVLNSREQRTSKSRFDDVWIDSCRISYSENIGIALDNEWGVYYPGGNEYNDWYNRRFSNVKITHNQIDHIGKNAMIVRCTDETGLVEYNKCSYTAMGTTGNTMFTARAKGTVFQYNEGSYNMSTIQTVEPGTIDGSMYDPDYGSIGVIFQYSYSHDNSEGIYWGCNTRSATNNSNGIPDIQDTGCTLRYCVSQNDLGKLVFLNYSSAGNEIYNNVFYVGSNANPTVISENSSNNHRYNFYNNIIYNLSGGSNYNFSNSVVHPQVRDIKNNIFYGVRVATEPTDEPRITLNPMLVNPGSGGSGLNTLDGYRLLPGSPAIQSGRIINNNGSFDLFGNTLPASMPPNIGVYQSSGCLYSFDLNSFDAHQQEQQVQIDWSTLHENATLSFGVERSADGVNFETLTEKPAATQSSALVSYQHIDNNPLTGFSYYRLKMKDQNNAVCYSEAKKVYVQTLANAITYPNPATDVLNVHVNRNSSLPLIGSIRNAQGKLYMENIMLNNQNSTISIADLPRGLYFLILTEANAGKYFGSIKFIK